MTAFNGFTLVDGDLEHKSTGTIDGPKTVLAKNYLQKIFTQKQIFCKGCRKTKINICSIKRKENFFSLFFFEW
jgi:hypothetical protein